MFNEAKSNMEGSAKGPTMEINIVFDSATKGLAKSIQSSKSWIPLKTKALTFHLVVVTTFLS